MNMSPSTGGTVQVTKPGDPRQGQTGIVVSNDALGVQVQFPDGVVEGFQLSSVMPGVPVATAIPMSQADVAAANIASGLQTGTVSGPSALSASVKDTSIIKLMPAGVRQPRKEEATCAALLLGVLSLVCFATLNHPEIRKNFDFLPATCEPFVSAGLHPEIRPFRHCSQSCGGCFPSWTPISCTSKLAMHYSINEYDLQASYYIAGSCAGPSCCAQQACQRCTKHETRCSRRLSVLGGEATAETTVEATAEAMAEATPWTARNTSSDLGLDDDADADYDRNEVVEEVEAAWEAEGDEAVTTWRRRLEGNCRQVTTTYDCNCRCVRRVAAKACTIRCLPHWRSFVPVRVSVYEAAPGFSASDTSAAAAATAYQALLTANASAKARAQQQTTINQTDSAKLVEVASAYTPPAFADAVMSADTDGAAYSRVVTVQYEHGASRSAALRHLDSPHFQPGVQSECFYDPLWRPTAAFIPRTQVPWPSVNFHDLP